MEQRPDVLQKVRVAAGLPSAPGSALSATQDPQEGGGGANASGTAWLGTQRLTLHVWGAPPAVRRRAGTPHGIYWQLSWEIVLCDMDFGWLIPTISGAAHRHVLKNKFLQSLLDSNDFVALQETRGAQADLGQLPVSHHYFATFSDVDLFSVIQSGRGDLSGCCGVLGGCLGLTVGCPCAGAGGFVGGQERQLVVGYCGASQPCMDHVG